MTRIVVYGVTGSGKTTLARRIAEALDLPFHEADALTWEPSWVEVPLEEQRRRIQKIVDQDAWVLDTMYGKWLDIPLSRAQFIVGLDYPRWVSLGRLIKRTLHRAATQQPVCNGNVERWSKVFSHDSIIAWHFKSFASKRKRLHVWAKESPNVILFRHPRQVEEWLKNLTETLTKEV